MHKAKRGRPPQTRVTRDLGTPEVVAKRVMALGKLPQGWPDLPTSLAEHPLGVLMWRGELGVDYESAKRLYDAGMKFGALWGRVFPRPHALSVMASMVPSDGGGEWSDTKLEQAEIWLRAVQAKLSSRQTYDAVLNCVVFRRVDFKRLGRVKVGLRQIDNVPLPELKKELDAA